MEQHFRDGDSLSLKEHFTDLKNPIRYHSVGKWFLFTTLITAILLIATMAIMLFFAWIKNTLPSNIKDILSFFGRIFGGFYLIVLLVTFYQSFILPKIIAGKILSFLRKYIPDATGIERKDTDTFFFNWKGNAMAISYKENVTEIVDARSPIGYRKKVDKYIKVSAATPIIDDYTPDDTTILEEGIKMVHTYNDAFVTFKKGKRFFQKDVTSALERLVKESAKHKP